MSTPRHVPVRRCAACRETRPKRALVRLVHADEGWRLDLAQRAGGRGTSLCPACAAAAVRAAAGVATRADADRVKGFRRAFRRDADAIAALLAPIASTLEPVLPLDDDARPRPNGGMHG